MTTHIISRDFRATQEEVDFFRSLENDEFRKNQTQVPFSQNPEPGFWFSSGSGKNYILWDQVVAFVAVEYRRELKFVLANGTEMFYSIEQTSKRAEFDFVVQLIVNRYKEWILYKACMMNPNPYASTPKAKPEKPEKSST